MFVPLTHNRLEHLYWTLTQGIALSDSECSKLATGFIGCNLVADLAEFFHDLLQPAVPGIASVDPIQYVTVRQWLQEPWTAGNPFVLCSHVVAEKFRQMEKANPWQIIHRWLAVEIIIRYLTGMRSTPAANHAQDVLDRILANREFDPPLRNSATDIVATRFHEWWLAFSDRLLRLFAQEIWQLRASPLDRKVRVMKVLAQGLSFDETLSRLVAAKNQQLAECLIRTRQRLCRPFPQAILRATPPQLPAFSEAKRRDLALILMWIVSQSPTAFVNDKIGGQRITHTQLYQLATGVLPSSNDPTSLSQIQTEWRDLLSLVNRNSPPDILPLMPSIVDWSWLRTVAGRLLLLDRNGGDLDIDQSDCSRWVAIVLWLHAHGYEAGLQADSPLWEIPRRCPDWVVVQSGRDLHRVYEDWNQVMKIVSSHGRPSRWSTSCWVQDLFSYPTPNKLAKWQIVPQYW